MRQLTYLDWHGAHVPYHPCDPSACARLLLPIAQDDANAVGIQNLSDAHEPR